MKTTARLTAVALSVLMLGTGLAATSVITPAPAAAQIDSGDGGGDNGGTGGGGGGGGTYQCRGNAWYMKTSSGWVRQYDYLADCDRGRGYTDTGQHKSGSLKGNGKQKLCATGMLVFRFYGNGNNPVPSYSVSRANPKGPCGTASKTYRLWRETPADATNANPGSPWQSGSTKWVNFQFGQADLNQVVSWHGELDEADPDDPDLLTTVTPEISLNGQRCDAQQTANPLKAGYQKVLNFDEFNIGDVNDLSSTRGKAALQIRQAVFDAIERLKGGWAGNATYMRTTYRQFGIDSGTWQVQKDWNSGNVSAYHLPSHTWLPASRFAEIFDDIPCSNSLQFTSTIPAGQENQRINSVGARNDFKVRGVCWIPLRRLSNVGSEGQNFPSIASSWNAGERLAKAYDGTAYTSGHPTQDHETLLETYLGGGSSNAYLNSYRNTMADWYTNMAKAGKGNSASKTSKRRFLRGDSDLQDVPAPAYDKSGGGWNRNQSLNWEAGRNQLRDNSKCMFADSVAAMDISGDEPPTQPKFSTSVQVNTPAYLRAGGETWGAANEATSSQSDPFTITSVSDSTRVNGVGCRIPANGEDCRSLIKFAQVSAGFNVASSTSFPEYTKDDGGAWYLAPFGQAPNGPNGTFRSLDPRFTRATNQSEKFNPSLNPANIRTDVTYVQRHLALPAMNISLPWVNTVVNIPAVTFDEDHNTTYTGLAQAGSPVAGRIVQSNPRTPGGTGTTSGVWSASYPVGGSVNK